MTDVNALAFELTRRWCDKLLEMQITERKGRGVYGGILCEACGYIHGRIGDLVYPLAALYARTGQEKYLRGAELALDWTERNMARPAGFHVNDSFNTWRGITLFYVIALGETFLDYGEKLPAELREKWMDGLLRAARACADDPLFAPGPGAAGAVNYPVAYLAAMAIVGKITGEARWMALARAREAHVLSYISPDGWLFGEGGGRIVTEKGCRNIDLGYNVEESVFHLALYGKLAEREQFMELAADLLRKHAAFLLPDGAWDNSWGSRAVKWTYYGSRTADGCQPACSLLQERDPLFAEVCLRNTELLARMTHDGLLTGGAMYSEAGYEACVHHSFCHAKATAYLLAHPIRPFERCALPREAAQGVEEVRDAGVTCIAQGNWRATMQNSDCRLLAGQEITGGSVTLLYHMGAGPLLVGNGVKLGIPEVTNMQIPHDMEGICQTVRLESGAFSSQLCTEAAVRVEEIAEEIVYTAQGRLSDGRGDLQGEYGLKYAFASDTVRIDAMCAQDARLWVPVISRPGAEVERTENAVRFCVNGHRVTVRADAEIRWIEGYEHDRIFNPAGGFCCLPLAVDVTEGRRVAVELRVE